MTDFFAVLKFFSVAAWAADGIVCEHVAYALRGLLRRRPDLYMDDELRELDLTAELRRPAQRILERHLMLATWPIELKMTDALRSTPVRSDEP